MNELTVGEKCLMDLKIPVVVSKILHDPKGIGEPFFIVLIEAEKLKVCRRDRLISLQEYRRHKLNQIIN